MNIINKPENWLEMTNYFYERTKKHIFYVEESLLKIYRESGDFKLIGVMERTRHHDESKYSTEEIEPYIWLTWYYKQVNAKKPFTYPEGVEDSITKAFEHHVNNNRHHPQYFDNVSEMLPLDLAEMIADHAAMSLELNNSLTEWTNTNTLKRYEWTKSQQQLIWKYVLLFPELK